MNLKGLTNESLKVFEAIKKSDLLQEYILIGGTALSLQINNRLSEDLDFCKWPDKPEILNKEVNWPELEKFSLLEPRYNVSSQDIQSFIREIINKEYGLGKS